MEHKPLMPAEDFARLRKLLALTTSTSDGEALTAIRLANAMLVKTKVHWFDLLDAVERGVTPPSYSYQQYAPPRRSAAQREIDDAFDLVMTTSRGPFKEFIQSLHDQWTDTGFLSPKQRSALFKAANRVKNGGWQDG